MSISSNNSFVRGNSLGLQNKHVLDGTQPKLKRKLSVRRNLFPANCTSLFNKTKRCLSQGVHKINQTFVSLRSTIKNKTQGLCINRYNRYELDHCDLVPSTHQTPSRRIRRILGRTPTKLYSPFDIETPEKFQ